MDVVDLLNPAKEPDFIEGDWISRGKFYPNTDTPSFIQAARNKAFAIPDEENDRIPSAATPVPEFLKFDIPSLSPSLVNVKAELWFSPDQPNASLAVLHKRTIPSDMLGRLDLAAGQRWFEGRNEIHQGSPL